MHTSVCAGAGVKINQPKMAWGEEAPQCSGSQPQPRKGSGAAKMPPIKMSLEEPKVAGMYQGLIELRKRRVYNKIIIGSHCIG